MKQSIVIEECRFGSFQGLAQTLLFAILQFETTTY
jgi:hypothetical protein